MTELVSLMLFFKTVSEILHTSQLQEDSMPPCDSRLCVGVLLASYISGAPSWGKLFLLWGSEHISMKLVNN